MPAFIPGISVVDQIYLLGAKLRTDIRQAINRATFSASADLTTEISMTLADPGFKLLKEGLVTDRMRVDFIGYWLEIATITTAEVAGLEGLELMIRPGGVQALKNRVGPLVMNNVSSTQFIAAECQAVGLAFVGQPTTTRNQVARDVPDDGDYDVEGEKPPSSWTTFQRLAEEEGYLVFEYMNTVIYGKPSWLIANVGTSSLARYTPGESTLQSTLDIPSCSRSDDNPDGITINTTLPLARLAELGVGRKFRLEGVPTFEADYITTGISFDMLDPNAVIDLSAIKPIDPKLYSKREEIPIVNYDGVARHGTKLAPDFTAWALAQIGDRYVFGAGTRFADDNPTQFDCSSLVQWACAQVGVSIPRTTYRQLDHIRARQSSDRSTYFVGVSAAANIRGALLYSAQNEKQGIGHVAISLGDGKTTIEAMNSQAGVRKGTIAGRFVDGCLIPDMTYPGRATTRRVQT